MLAVSLVSTFVLATAAYVAARVQLSAFAGERLDADVADRARHVTDILEGLSYRVRALAGSELVRTALVDPSERARHLELLRDFQPSRTVPAEVVLCDAAGHPFTDDPGRAAPLAEWLAGLARDGESGVRLLDAGGGRHRLAIATSVLPPGRGVDRGALLAVFEPAALVAPLPDEGLRLTTAGGAVLAQRGRLDWSQAITREVAVAEATPFRGLGLRLVMGTPRAQALEGLGGVAIGYAALTLAVIAGSLAAARLVSERLTRRMRTLSQGAARIAAQARLDQGLHVPGTDEIAQTAEAFNGMLGRLHEATEARLAELEGRNAALVTAHEEARQLQLELHQAQKLEAVGQLAAGIAHEINTPIQYIGDNTNFLREVVEASFAQLDRLGAALAEHAPPHVRAALEEEADRLDLPYLREHAGRTVKNSLEGIERVATIVRAMKEFAHPDQREMVATDLNRALQATLEVARNEIKYVAEVETRLGTIPLVVCHAGDVNQVFLNLIVNAAQAIGDRVKAGGARGHIRISTAPDPGGVRVSVADDGPGIPEDVQNRIFEPFFTTKEVGRGTGQGLAICRATVERHRGSIWFETEAGRGTTFHVLLPADGGAGEATGAAA